MKKLTVIIPDADDDQNTFIQQNKNFLIDKSENIQLLFVNHDQGFNRADRINYGMSQAQGEMILLCHPRNLLPKAGVYFLLSNCEKQIWGGFTHQFDLAHFLLNWTSWYSNNVRGPRGILYLDHCIFFHRSFWQKNLPSVDIFEDTILSQNLRKIKKPLILSFVTITASIRFKKNGIYRQAFLNQVLKLGFFMGFSKRKMNQIYEKKISLNSNYK